VGSFRSTGKRSKPSIHRLPDRDEDTFFRAEHLTERRFDE
jgi:hypothetical protein